MVGFGYILLCLVAVICIACIVFKKYIRPKFPARVTCWFCGTKTRVPYGEADGFECPSCDQYNGFNEDGDYNKPIPAQYDELSNKPSPCRPDEFIGGVDFLCDRCSENQLLKVKQLAKFVPYLENNYEWEATAFERHLEKVYKICSNCETKVQRELDFQNETIAMHLRNSNSWTQGRCFHQVPDDDMTHLNHTITSSHGSIGVMVSLILHALSLGCAVGLLLCKLDISQLGWSAELHPLLIWLDRHTELQAWVGLASGLTAKLCVGKYRISILDVVSSPVWLVILLIQTGFIPYTLVGLGTDLVCTTANAITCLLCLGVNRNRLSQVNISVIRSPGFGSRSVEMQGPASPAMLEEDVDDDDDIDIGEAPGSCDIGSLIDRLSGVDSWIRRDSGPRQNDSGLLSAGSQDCHPSGSGSGFRSQSHIRPSVRPSFKPHPLISPASFSYTSTPAKHRFGLGPPIYGLFSGQQEPLLPFQGTSNLFSSDLHRYPPAKPAVQRFGMVPYSLSSYSRVNPGTLIRPPLWRSPLLKRETEETECREPEVKETQQRHGHDQPADCGEMVENLVEKLLDLQTFTQKQSGLRRTDSGFFSCISDFDIPSVSSNQSVEQTVIQVSPHPRQLIRSAVFEYQSALSPQSKTTLTFMN